MFKKLIAEGVYLYIFFLVVVLGASSDTDTDAAVVVAVAHPDVIDLVCANARDTLLCAVA